jgi:hypothetical protein
MLRCEQNRVHGFFFAAAFLFHVSKHGTTGTDSTSGPEPSRNGGREAVIFEIEAVIAMQAHDYLSLNTAATFAGTFYASARIRSA